MSDDTTITPGAGATVAADNVGGKLHQRVKLSVGADGEAADLDGGQQTMANSLPVVIASDQTAIPTAGGAAAITLYNVAMASANTEYSQALPATCRRVALQCRGAYAVRMAFVTGKVATPTAPYLTIKESGAYDSGPVTLSGATVYVACGTAGQVVEIEAWS